jgi:hypothetical protein
MAANRVRWGTRSALVAALSHFPELKSKLEFLGFGQNVDLSDDQVDDLTPLVSVASDSLASLVPSSIPVTLRTTQRSSSSLVGCSFVLKIWQTQMTEL